MFDGTLGLKIFTGILAFVLSATWFYFKSMKTIEIDMFQDDGVPMTQETSLKWWNYFRHPLTVSSESRTQMVEKARCKNSMT